MTLSLREFHPRRVEVRAARVIISRTARYHNSQFSIIHSQFKKGTDFGSLFAYCCGFFLWKLNFGSLIFLNRPERREATLSVSE